MMVRRLSDRINSLGVVGPHGFGTVARDVVHVLGRPHAGLDSRFVVGLVLAGDVGHLSC